MKIKIFIENFYDLIENYLPRISLFRYGSRLHVHGRNCFKSVTFKRGSPLSIQSSNLRPLRSSCKRGSFDVGINGLILKKEKKKHLFK